MVRLVQLFTKCLLIEKYLCYPLDAVWLRVEYLREALHAFGKSRCSSGGEMAMRKYQNCDGIPLEDPPLVDGVMGAIYQ